MRVPSVSGVGADAFYRARGGSESPQRERSGADAFYRARGKQSESSLGLLGDAGKPCSV